VPKKAKKKTVVRREYTKADVKELRAHSKASRANCEAYKAQCGFVAAEGA
jgi:hypothetical protein